MKYILILILLLNSLLGVGQESQSINISGAYSIEGQSILEVDSGYIIAGNLMREINEKPKAFMLFLNHDFEIQWSNTIEFQNQDSLNIPYLTSNEEYVYAVISHLNTTKADWRDLIIAISLETGEIAHQFQTNLREGRFQYNDIACFEDKVIAVGEIDTMLVQSAENRDGVYQEFNKNLNLEVDSIQELYIRNSLNSIDVFDDSYSVFGTAYNPNKNIIDITFLLSYESDFQQFYLNKLKIVNSLNDFNLFKILDGYLLTKFDGFIKFDLDFNIISFHDIAALNSETGYSLFDRAKNFQIEGDKISHLRLGRSQITANNREEKFETQFMISSGTDEFELFILLDSTQYISDIVYSKSWYSAVKNTRIDSIQNTLHFIQFKTPENNLCFNGEEYETSPRFFTDNGVEKTSIQAFVPGRGGKNTLTVETNSLDLSAISECTNVSITERNSGNIQIYPTVIGEGISTIQILNPEGGDFEYSVFDISGKFIQQGQVLNQQIQLKNLPQGAYLLNVLEDQQKVKTEKIIVTD